MNKSFLIGRITKKPELRYTAADKAVCGFSVAIDRPFTSRDGEKQTDFINIKVFDKQAENVSKYCDKGSLVAIDGRIQTGSYEDKDGKRVYTTEVVADRVQFLDTKKEKEESVPEPVEEKPSKLSDDVFASFGEQVEFDEELGF